MSDEPYPAPIGQKWIKGWFGEWVLVPDPDQPPVGYRFKIDFFTGKRALTPTYSSEIDAVEGLGSAGADRNSVNTPNYGPPSRQYSYATPDPSKMTPSHEFYGPRSADANPDPALRKIGKTRYNSGNGNDEPAIF